jgi:hypothetical protein
VHFKKFQHSEKFFSHVEFIDIKRKYFALRRVPESLIEKHELIESEIMERGCVIKCQHPVVVSL